MFSVSCSVSSVSYILFLNYNCSTHSEWFFLRETAVFTNDLRACTVLFIKRSRLFFFILIKLRERFKQHCTESLFAVSIAVTAQLERVYLLTVMIHYHPGGSVGLRVTTDIIYRMFTHIEWARHHIIITVPLIAIYPCRE